MPNTSTGAAVQYYLRQLLHRTAELSPFSYTTYYSKELLPTAHSNDKQRRSNSAVNTLIFGAICMTLLYCMVQLAPDLLHSSDNIKPTVWLLINASSTAETVLNDAGAQAQTT